MYIDQAKTQQMLEFLEAEHFRYRRRADAVPTEGELDLSLISRVEVQAPGSPLIQQIEEDFRRFLQTCMDVRTGEDKGAKIIFHSTGVVAKDESYTIRVADGKVLVEAAGERGLLHAAHYIEKCMAFRGGPFLENGTVERKTAFSPRILQSVFCMSSGSIDSPIMFTDDYLSLMSHFGVNGIHIYACIWDYCRNTRLPELNTVKYEENMNRLRTLCERAGKYGIDIYGVMVTKSFGPSDEVFRAHPEVRGALLNYPVPNPEYCLCSSNPDVLECYRQAFTNLFMEIPQLGGAYIIVGGEGFMHCFTRPKPPFEGNTSCPHCSGRNPSEDVASLMNLIAGTIHAASSDAGVYAWPYSAFTWSSDADPCQKEFISKLNPDVRLMSNFSTPYFNRLGEASASLIDYNIVNVGPSEVFRTQSEALPTDSIGHYAKIECTTEPGWYFLPYLPVHYRWVDRINSMKKHGVPGFVAQWRFYGFTGSLPEELLSMLAWEDTDADALLRKIATRDFGTASDELLKGWRILSDTWPRIPSSHMIFGERQFYMKGPAYLGPAHPLIFDVQNRYGLCKDFFTVRGDLGELLPEEELRELEKDAPPKYSSDLLFTYPFGADVVENRLEEVVQEWDSGVSLLQKALGESPTNRAVMELDICRILGCHVRSMWNVARFYRARDAFFTGVSNLEKLGEQFDRLTEIIDDEIQNAQRALPVLDRDFRIGYGHCYGQVYDAGMVRDKIRQCEYVRNVELRSLKSDIIFHVYNKYVP